MKKRTKKTGKSNGNHCNGNGCHNGRSRSYLRARWSGRKRKLYVCPMCGELIAPRNWEMHLEQTCPKIQMPHVPYCRRRRQYQKTIPAS